MAITDSLAGFYSQGVMDLVLGWVVIWVANTRVWVCDLGLICFGFSSLGLWFWVLSVMDQVMAHGIFGNKFDKGK